MLELEGGVDEYSTLDTLVPTNEGEIGFKAAVAEATRLAKTNSANQMRLGEIGAKVRTEYGKRTLRKLAEASGIPYPTFKGYVTVYRAYEGEKMDCPSFSVLQALAAHPDRLTLLSDNPEMSVKEARKLMHQWKKATAPKLKDKPAQKLEAAWDKFERSIEPFMSSVSEKTVNAFGVMQDAINNFKSVLALDLNEKIEPDDYPEPDEPKASPVVEPPPAPGAETVVIPNIEPPPVKGKLLKREETERIALETFMRDAPDGYPRNNLVAYSRTRKDDNGGRYHSGSIWFEAVTSKSIHLCYYRFLSTGLTQKYEPLNEVLAKIKAEDDYQRAFDEKRAARGDDPPHVKKYLAIAEAIKAEAGVQDHIVSDKRGHARKDKVIRAPQGRTIKQLHVIAHECGHVFHNHPNRV